MSLVFDTSILISIEKNDKVLMKKLSEMRDVYPSAPQISFVTYFEYMIGLKLHNNKFFSERLQFLNKFNVLNTTQRTAEILSDLKIKYDKSGKGLSLADLLIASLVIENDLTLLTMDSDFKRIDELKKIII